MLSRHQVSSATRRFVIANNTRLSLSLPQFATMSGDFTNPWYNSNCNCNNRFNAHSVQYYNNWGVPITPRMPITQVNAYNPGMHMTFPIIGTRYYSTGRRPRFWDEHSSDWRKSRHWDKHSSDWRKGAKTGALIVAGGGALLLITPVLCPLFVMGAAGYGLYHLYLKFTGPKWYDGPSPRGWGDPHKKRAEVEEDVDELGSLFREKDRAKMSKETRRAVDELDAVFQSLPFFIRNTVKGVLNMAGSAMESSMKRADKLLYLAEDAIYDCGPVMKKELGEDFRIQSPNQWMESSVNGQGSVEAVFPIVGENGERGEITAKAKITSFGDKLKLDSLMYRNLRTGETIDLLDEKKTFEESKIDAEYKEKD